MTASHSVLDDPKHWLERAEEARSIADQLSDPESRRMMLRIAKDYERSQFTPHVGRAGRRRAETRRRPGPFETNGAWTAASGGAIRARIMMAGG
jgi:hypothetical protein